MRRWFAQAVALVLLLPMLIGLMPQPALSAAAALERDVLLSVCGSDQSQQPGSEHHATHDHCVLCGNHGPSFTPTLASAAPAFTAVPRQSSSFEAIAAGAIPLLLQALLDASPPRGPPASA